MLNSLVHSIHRQPKAKHVSLAARAYYAIRERILKGDIALGAPLSRRKLAIELGMSLLPAVARVACGTVLLFGIPAMPHSIYRRAGHPAATNGWS